MKKLSNITSNEDILYELIISTNLPFKIEIYSEFHSKFYIDKVEILRISDKFIISNNDISNKLTTDFLDIDDVIMFFDASISHELEELNLKIEKLKALHSESLVSRNSKTIANFININHLDIREVGCNHLVFVNSLYTNSYKSLDYYSKKYNNLNRFINEFEINRDAIVYLMTPEKYREYISNNFIFSNQKLQDLL